MAERKKVQKVSLLKPSSNNVKKKPAKSSAAKHKEVKGKKRPRAENVITMSLDSKNTNQRQSTRPAGGNTNSNSRAKVLNNPQKSPVSNSSKLKNQKPREKRKSAINWSIISGNKKGQKRKSLSRAVFAAFLAIIIILFLFVTPTGPIEAITNSFAVIGGGTFPKTVVGSKAVSLKGENSNAFLLTNTHICGYNSNGKELFEYQHDFSAPALETSKSRILVYNRRSTGYMVLNNSNVVHKKEAAEPIYCATIADNGSVAMVTESEKYSAQVDVYNAGMKHKFTWYLVDGLISDVALSSNGKYVAVSVFKAKNGSYSSEIYCFNINKENPIFTINVEDTPIYSLENISDKYFSYVTNKSVCYVNWTDGAENKFEESGLSPSFLKVYKQNVLAVFGKNTSATVKIVGSNGAEKARFVYNGLVDDVALDEKYVYILKGNEVFAIDFEGKIQKTYTPEQAPSFITTTNKGLFTTDNINCNFYKR